MGRLRAEKAGEFTANSTIHVVMPLALPYAAEMASAYAERRREEHRSIATYQVAHALASEPRLRRPVSVLLVRSDVGTVDRETLVASLAGVRQGIADVLGDPVDTIAWTYQQTTITEGRPTVVAWLKQAAVEPVYRGPCVACGQQWARAATSCARFCSHECRVGKREVAA